MTPAAKRRRVPCTVYFEPAQLEALTALSKRTRVPKAVYVRDGLAMVLVKHALPVGRAIWTDEKGAKHDFGPVFAPVMVAKGRKR